MPLKNLVQQKSTLHVLIAVLSGPAIERINNSAITKLVVLILLKCQKNVKVKKLFNFQLLTLLADAIIRIHERRPLSPLFELHLPSEQI